MTSSSSQVDSAAVQLASSHRQVTCRPKPRRLRCISPIRHGPQIAHSSISRGSRRRRLDRWTRFASTARRRARKRVWMLGALLLRAKPWRSTRRSELHGTCWVPCCATTAGEPGRPSTRPSSERICCAIACLRRSDTARRRHTSPAVRDATGPERSPPPKPNWLAETAAPSSLLERQSASSGSLRARKSLNVAWARQFPDRASSALGNIAELQMDQGNFDGAAATVERLRQRFPSYAALRQPYLLFAKGDLATLQRLVDSMRQSGPPNERVFATRAAANLALLHGRLRERNALLDGVPLSLPSIGQPHPIDEVIIDRASSVRRHGLPRGSIPSSRTRSHPQYRSRTGPTSPRPARSRGSATRRRRARCSSGTESRSPTPLSAAMPPRRCIRHSANWRWPNAVPTRRLPNSTGATLHTMANQSTNARPASRFNWAVHSTPPTGRIPRSPLSSAISRRRTRTRSRRCSIQFACRRFTSG